MKNTSIWVERILGSIFKKNNLSNKSEQGLEPQEDPRELPCNNLDDLDWGKDLEEIEQSSKTLSKQESGSELGGDVDSKQEIGLRIPNLDEYYSYIKDLKDQQLPELEKKIDSAKNELAKTEGNLANKKNKREKLERDLENEKKYYAWFTDEVRQLEQIRKDIEKRAENVPPSFTNEYCSRINKQLGASISEINNFPHNHKNNMNVLGSDINTIGFDISDADTIIKELKKDISTYEKSRDTFVSKLRSGTEFRIKKLQPLIDNLKEIKILLDTIREHKDSSNDYHKQNLKLSNLQNKIRREIDKFLNAEETNTKSKNPKSTNNEGDEERKFLEERVPKASTPGFEALLLCKRCHGNGCLQCNNTGYQNH